MKARKILDFFLLFKKAFLLFINNNGFKLSAALSYYTVFSLAPFLIIVISLTGIVLGKQAVEGKIFYQIAGLIGNDSAKQLQELISNVSRSNHTTIGAIIGFIVLIFGASGVFSEIQSSINYLWQVQSNTRKAWWILVTSKLWAFSVLVSMSFLLLVSLVISAMMDLLSARLKVYFANSMVMLFNLFDMALLLVCVACLFTLIFKILPNAIIRWKDVMVGAAMTAILFLIGKFIIGFYLGNSKIGLTYGTAASIVILMLWVYYSSIILYFGACFTQAYAESFGKKILSRG